MSRDRRGTTATVSGQQENTYQMEPKRVFKSYKARNCAKVVVEKHINHDTEYTARIANDTAIAISRDLLRDLKALKYERYRFVVQTFIGQKRGQGVQVSSRSLHDANTDTFTEFTFENRSLYCVVVVFGIYFE